MSISIEDTNPHFYLHHYTSLPGLLGIIQEKEIWASNALFLNDSQEIKGAIEMLIDYLNSTKSDEGTIEFSELRSVLLKKLDFYAFKDLGKILNVSIFVCSFSSNQDTLSQWRGYCPENSGACISLEINKNFQKRLHDQHFTLVKCQYKKDDSFPECLSSFVDRIYKRMQNFPQSFSLSTKIDQALNNFEMEFIKTAIQIKDEAFVDEDEWRIVSEPLPQSSKMIEYRVGKSMLIPYIPIKLCDNKSDPINIPKICLGPTPHKELSYHSVTYFLIKNQTFAYIYQLKELCEQETKSFVGDFDSDDETTTTEVVSSYIPFRSW